MRDGRSHPRSGFQRRHAVTAVQPSLAQLAACGRRRDGRREPNIGGSRAAPLLAFLAVFLLGRGLRIWVFASRSETDPFGRRTIHWPPRRRRQPNRRPATTPPTPAPTTAAPVTGSGPSSTTVPAAPAAGKHHGHRCGNHDVAARRRRRRDLPSPATVAPANAAVTTQAPVTAAPVVMPTTEPGPIGETEALAFVVTYYEQVNAGQYDAKLAEVDAGVPRRPKPHVRELRPILAQHVASTR